MFIYMQIRIIVPFSRFIWIYYTSYFVDNKPMIVPYHMLSKGKFFSDSKKVPIIWFHQSADHQWLLIQVPPMYCASQWLNHLVPHFDCEFCIRKLWDNNLFSHFILGLTCVTISNHLDLTPLVYPGYVLNPCVVNQSATILFDYESKNRM